jgi:hypothetical protein
MKKVFKAFTCCFEIRKDSRGHGALSVYSFLGNIDSPYSFERLPEVK